ncbi:DUF6364 family protein [Kaistella jeonii]|uniref:Uncharacterized protein n=1 Tax=Kaistella jeonii TaxID=266749 RepID=A0A0C1D2Z2_9FLAO|nr:DUF6364 family protein [Kaistella jeonii]KIA88135.1 hypothetical protein OA86_12345 [Kaistella jeonii]SFC29000.1 hypothetical protein SAMN05421876_11235 [Kaistella jeonii]VEI96903.1 Uncharacterised protein [Kaistella jeonii]
MKTKFTLKIDKSVIKKAKKFAFEKERSLFDLIKNYLRILTNEDISSEVEISANLQSMKGAFEMSKDFDYKKDITLALSKKYL